jgi:molybdenum cofactor cytidylyltransferase
MTRAEDLERSTGQIEGVTLVTGPEGADQRLSGLDMEALNGLRELADRLGFSLLIEADGARQKALKAPAAHEPAIPEWVDTVVVVAGMSGLGKPLDEQTVHRVEAFSALSGLRMGEAITAVGLARVLRSEQGGLKGIPAGARKVLLLNQAGSADLAAHALRIANLVKPAYDAVVIAELAESRVMRVVEPVAGIILAGGGSSRFGQPKMLLPWRGKPLIRCAVEAALEAGLAEVVVVSGAVEDDPRDTAAMRDALAGLPVRMVANPDWRRGQSTSLRAGLTALQGSSNAALFLLADQPFVTAELIRALVGRHETTLAPVIAPRVGEKRTNPVLFDRVTFDALLALEGDTGGRAIFERFPPGFVDWGDERLLLDIDTPEDYQHLLGME